MAQIDEASATLIPFGLARPDVAVDAAAREVACDCNGSIMAGGAVTLRGIPGENLAGWALGYIQLKFIATDYARYRGLREADGSVRVTRSNQILCRDTDEATPELWYDPIAWGIHGLRGTRVLAAGTLMPTDGSLAMFSGFLDAPRRHFNNTVVNTVTHRVNSLHHVDVGLQFCTILAAREPGGTYHLLKHFYWNVRWECHFRPDGAGVPAVRRPVDHMQLNIQHKVHSGPANDRRFRHRELDANLPVSNLISRRPARVHPSRSWAEG